MYGTVHALAQRPPKGFTIAQDVRHVRAIPASALPFVPGSDHPKGAKRRGLQYETKVHHFLRAVYGDAYIPSQWYMYYAGGLSQPRYCQIDGMITFPRFHIIVEVKYQHCQLAWWQLRHLYQNVMECYLGGERPRIVEVCRWYDLSIALPEEPLLLRDIGDAQEGRFNLYSWAP